MRLAALAAGVTAWLTLWPLAGETRVVLLGTGTPNADPQRSGPAAAVVVDGKSYLIDSGPGVVRRASAAAAKAKMPALEAKNLRIAFITHLHSDHTAGLADLILTPGVLERDAPLALYGPPGLKSMVSHLLAAYKEDLDIRLHGGEPSKPRGYIVNSTEIRRGGGVYKDDAVTVEAIPVQHGKWRYAYGYKFTSKDQRTIVVSGDAVPTESIVAACNGCDVLVHEVYSQAGFAKRPPEWQRYHSAYHTSTAQLAELANRAKPKLLVLYHQLIWSSNPEEMLREVRAHYSGEVRSGSDLDVY